MVARIDAGGLTLSYILTAGIATPVSIADGGTGQITAFAAMTALSSPTFQASSVNPMWGIQHVPLSPFPDAIQNQLAINALISALQAIGVII